MVSATVETRNNLVLVFMRAPRLGRVKTRLARVLEPRTVLGLYKCFVADTLASVRAAGYTATACIHPPEEVKKTAAWLGHAYPTAAQEGGDLGARMAHAFVREFDAGKTRVLLVGTDIPDLPPDIYRRAFAALASHPAVIGPALDGGYYLVGFRNDGFTPEIFTRMPWGTDRVFAKTVHVFESRGIRVQRLPPWRDLDTYEDLVSFDRKGDGGGKITRAYLDMIGPLQDLWRRRIKSD